MVKKSEKGEKVSKKSKNQSSSVRNILVAVLVVIVLVAGYLIVSMDSDEDKSIEENEVVRADALSEGAFDYINQYRTENDLESLDFNYELYLVALNLSNQKSQNKLSFRQAPERNDFISSNFDLSEFPVQYNSIYEIDEKGLNGFKDEFDRVYFVQNIIKSDKYDSGAIGCNLDYCSLILLSEEGEIEVMKDY